MYLQCLLAPMHWIHVALHLCLLCTWTSIPLSIRWSSGSRISPVFRGTHAYTCCTYTTTYYAQISMGFRLAKDFLPKNSNGFKRAQHSTNCVDFGKVVIKYVSPCLIKYISTSLNTRKHITTMERGGKNIGSKFRGIISSPAWGSRCPRWLVEVALQLILELPKFSGLLPHGLLLRWTIQAKKKFCMSVSIVLS